jgi:hypothetical protein
MFNSRLEAGGGRLVSQFRIETDSHEKNGGLRKLPQLPNVARIIRGQPAPGTSRTLIKILIGRSPRDRFEKAKFSVATVRPCERNQPKTMMAQSESRTARGDHADRLPTVRLPRSARISHAAIQPRTSAVRKVVLIDAQSATPSRLTRNLS